MEHFVIVYYMQSLLPEHVLYIAIIIYISSVRLLMSGNEKNRYIPDIYFSLHPFIREAMRQ